MSLPVPLSMSLLTPVQKETKDQLEKRKIVLDLQPTGPRIDQLSTSRKESTESQPPPSSQSAASAGRPNLLPTSPAIPAGHTTPTPLPAASSAGHPPTQQAAATSQHCLLPSATDGPHPHLPPPPPTSGTRPG